MTIDPNTEICSMDNGKVDSAFLAVIIRNNKLIILILRAIFTFIR